MKPKLNITPKAVHEVVARRKQDTTQRLDTKRRDDKDF